MGYQVYLKNIAEPRSMSIISYTNCSLLLQAYKKRKILPPNRWAIDLKDFHGKKKR